MFESGSSMYIDDIIKDVWNRVTRDCSRRDEQQDQMVTIEKFANEKFQAELENTALAYLYNYNRQFYEAYQDNVRLERILSGALTVINSDDSQELQSAQIVASEYSYGLEAIRYHKIIKNLINDFLKRTKIRNRYVRILMDMVSSYAYKMPDQGIANVYLLETMLWLSEQLTVRGVGKWEWRYMIKYWKKIVKKTKKISVMKQEQQNYLLNHMYLLNRKLLELVYSGRYVYRM